MDARQNWLLRYIALQSKYDIRINTLLEEAAIDAEAASRRLVGRTGVGATARRGQLLNARAALNRRLADFWRALGDVIRAGQFEAAAAALDAEFDWDDALLARSGLSEEQRASFRQALLATAGKNVEAMIARVFTSKVPLSTQVYRTEAIADGWMDRTINSAIARGDSADDIARQVRQFVSPRTKGGIAYAARRLGRTEINNAYHAQSIEHNSEKPWVKHMKWNLSKSHPKPDICDKMAKKTYPRGEVPRKPHPQCLCFTTPVNVTQTQFLAGLAAGDYDDWMERNYNAVPGRAVA